MITQSALGFDDGQTEQLVLNIVTVFKIHPVGLISCVLSLWLKWRHLHKSFDWNQVNPAKAKVAGQA
jgi:hypothetical protein